MDATLTRLLTDKAELGRSRLDHPPRPEAGDDGAVLAIRRLALTTNNVTYAAFGDAMRYWDFFPTGVDGWGHMPAWGFADVVASAVPGVEVGERYYGYWPIASHLRMQPVRVTERGFYDGLPHRLDLVSAYNQYTRCSTDPVWRADDEDYQALLRPLFITSFFLADFLQDHGAFGARRLLFSSASSKTAYGTAHALGAAAGVERVGLTSARHRDFVQALGCYDRVLAYEELEPAVDTATPTVYVDFSGDPALRARVHHHLGAALLHDCYAGSAQNTGFIDTKQPLPGPKPQFYFAPVQIKKRTADWGTAGVNQRFGDAQLAFIAHVRRAGWIDVSQARGFEAAQQVIAGLVAGHADPKTGQIVLL